MIRRPKGEGQDDVDEGRVRERFERLNLRCEGLGERQGEADGIEGTL